MKSTIGWDIGGVNTKAALVRRQNGAVAGQEIISRPFAIWQKRDALTYVLREIAGKLGPAEEMAITMTAELSDAFLSKGEGVSFILDCFQEVFPSTRLFVFDVNGRFTDIATARMNPLQVAASNWVASALLVSRFYPDCLLVDIGSTTADIIPVVHGRVAAAGRDDPSRLQAGELVYTGALRANVNTIVSKVPVKGVFTRVAAEHFAITGDIHLLLGNLSEDQYSCETPDGRGKTADFASARLARLVCADAGMLSKEEILDIARYIQEKQVQILTEAVLQVLSRFPGSDFTMVVAGLGQFLAEKCALRTGLKVAALRENLSQDAAVAAPCFAVSLLLAEKLEEGST